GPHGAGGAVRPHGRGGLRARRQPGVPARRVRGGGLRPPVDDRDRQPRPADRRTVARVARPVRRRDAHLLQPGRGRVRQVRPQHLQRHQDQLLERDVARRPEARRRPRPDRRHRRALRGGLDQPRVRHPRRRPLRRRLPAQGHPGLPRLRRRHRRRHAAAVGRGGDQRPDRRDRRPRDRPGGARRRRRPARAEHGRDGTARVGMNLPIYYYLLGTPLGVLGLIRWGTWLVRRIPAVVYQPVINDHRLPLSIVVPVYQEDPQILATAIESWLANDVEEVILVIDASDTSSQDAAARYPVTVLITDVPGKRDALRRGWRAARTELAALVDADTKIGRAS